MEVYMSLKVRIAIVMIVPTILALACGKLEIGIEPNDGVFFDANLNAAPAQEQVPKNCPLSDFNVYVNATFGYCFGYPLDFTIEDSTVSNPEVRGPAIGSEIEPVFATLKVEVDPKSETLSLREQAGIFLQEFSVVDTNSYTWEQIEIDGEPSLVVAPVPAYLSWKIIFVGHNSNFYRLMYWPVDVQEAELDLDDLYQVTTQTFEFIE
jgi:hypothetical protein